MYESIRDTAASVLAKFGQPLTLIKTTPGVFDPSSGEESGAVVTQYQMTGIRSVPNTQGAGDQYAAGSAVMQCDFLFICFGPVAPLEGDQLVAGGNPYQVINVKEISPAGIPLIWKVAVKR